MINTDNIRIVYVTTDSLDNAKQIAKILVSERLAACVSIINNCTSIYGWQGSVQESYELLLMIKTLDNKIDALEKRIKEIHTYEVPEIIAVKVDSSNEAYLNWMNHTISQEA